MYPGVPSCTLNLDNFYRLNNDLTANSNHFYFDYKDGKYGYNTDPNRGADTFAPFKNGLMPNISLGNMNCYLNFQEDENITYVKFQLTILSGNYGRVMVNLSDGTTTSWIGSSTGIFDYTSPEGVYIKRLQMQIGNTNSGFTCELLEYS